ncbi:hypothetical protein TNIN_160651 [Trichonephila inaurata madagascariensis]|uniref:Uncharacterized protein n=1 Tax=Trichonephila inaurata madagascariensis TaxID=2747483 RepID=A0A8X7C6J2_9ARAC|nr:hypothetical protein TNIN_160651 [Trichonephila inaurata madagascariensis]
MPTPSKKERLCRDSQIAGAWSIEISFLALELFLWVRFVVYAQFISETMQSSENGSSILRKKYAQREVQWWGQSSYCDSLQWPFREGYALGISNRQSLVHEDFKSSLVFYIRI